MLLRSSDFGQNGRTCDLHYRLGKYDFSTCYSQLNYTCTVYLGLR